MMQKNNTKYDMERPNLDFLYYQTPEEYDPRFNLDGPLDPKHDAIIDASIRFKSYMQACPQQDLVSTLIICLKDKYLNPSSIYLSIIESFYSAKEGKPIRDDIKDVKFTYKMLKDKESVKPHPKQMRDDNSYLFSLSITFRQSQTQLLSWIKQELKDKALTEDVRGVVTTLRVADSPIERVEIEGKTLRILMDRDSYIAY